MIIDGWFIYFLLSKISHSMICEKKWHKWKNEKLIVVDPLEKHSSSRKKHRKEWRILSFGHYIRGNCEPHSLHFIQTNIVWIKNQDQTKPEKKTVSNNNKKAVVVVNQNVFLQKKKIIIIVDRIKNSVCCLFRVPGSVVGSTTREKNNPKPKWIFFKSSSGCIWMNDWFFR